jgi:hypothetical protein
MKRRNDVGYRVECSKTPSLALGTGPEYVSGFLCQPVPASRVRLIDQLSEPPDREFGII